MKKFMVVLLALVMVLGMSVSAFADEKDATYVEILEDNVLVEEVIEVVVEEQLVLTSKTFKDGNEVESWGWAYDEEAFRMIDEPSFKTVIIDDKEYYVSEATFEALKAGEYKIEFEIVMYNKNHTWTGSDVVEVEVVEPTPTVPSIDWSNANYCPQGKSKFLQLDLGTVTITGVGEEPIILDGYKVGGFRSLEDDRNFSIEAGGYVFNFTTVDGVVSFVGYVAQ